MKKSKNSPKHENDFGKTFTKNTSKSENKSLNPFDTSSSSSSEYHEVEPGYEAIKRADDINCDSLERAYKDLEKSIEYLEAHTQVPKVELNSLDGPEKRTTNLSVVEENLPSSPTNSSFEGSLRLSPRMARATILRPRSASPKNRSSCNHDSQENGREYNDLWEKRSSSPGFIEYLSDHSSPKSPKSKPKNDSPTKKDAKNIQTETSTEKVSPSTVEEATHVVEESHLAVCTPNTVQMTPSKTKTASVSSTIGDEFFFDERDFYELSDMESDLSFDEFELRSVLIEIL